MTDAALLDHNPDLITVVPTADAVDANLLPISHEPVGAKRQARDFKALVASGRVITVPGVEALKVTILLFADKIKAAGLEPTDVVFAIQGGSPEVGAPDDIGIWVTTRDQPVGDTALFTRIA